MHLFLRSSVFVLAAFIPSILFAQKKPTNFVLGTSAAATPATTYNIPGFGNDYTGTNYTVSFGKTDNATTGINRFVKLFNIEGESYTAAKAVAGDHPFRAVVISRNSNSIKTTALFETGSTSGNNIYLRPDYTATMEELLNSYIINRGTDNVFINSGTTSNNIERFDMLLANPVDVSKYNPNTSGFLFMERGGNDRFKVSAITGVTGNTVTALNVPVSINNSTHWGSTGQNIFSVVMQRRVSGFSPTDADLKPSQNIGSQSISGVFVTLAQLGATSGTLYGVSFFAGDVKYTTGTDQLLTINSTNYPTNTSESNNDGLDFMAGGGFFTRAILINGTIWIDQKKDAIRASNEEGTANGLWANLVSPSGKVISSMPVNPDGTYKTFISSNNVAAGNYKIILTNSEKYEGNDLSEAENPQNGFYYTGVNVNGTAATSNRSGIIDIGALYKEDFNDIADVNNVNFGIWNPALPITLGAFNATISGENQLHINWSTVSEKNNDHFDIEVSENGAAFKKIGTVISKATNGNADNAINYAFTFDMTAINIALGFSLLSLLFITLPSGKISGWLRLAPLFTGIILLGLASCMKKDYNSLENPAKLFVRLKQVDKNGDFEYSKAIQAVKK